MNDSKIFGYDFDDIQRAQQGGCLSRPVSGEPNRDIEKHLESDKELLEKYGKQGLERMKYYGVLDRLKRGGLI